VKVDVGAHNSATGTIDPIIISTFTMVATFEGKAAPVNRLKPETEQENIAYKLGEGNVKDCYCFCGKGRRLREGVGGSQDEVTLLLSKQKIRDIERSAVKCR